METRVSRFCEGLIEAGWLAAAILTPLFIDPYSERPFAKVGLVWAIALVMATAWLVARLERTRGIGEGEIELHLSLGPLRNPLLAGALALGAVTLLSTLTSVAPRISLWGHYLRPQGTFTFLAYTAIFLLALTNLQTRQQVERLVLTLLLASFPVALYGVLQRYGLDLLLVGKLPAGRVYSSIGNPIPLGGYVMMMMPLTAARLIGHLRTWWARGWRDPMVALAVGLYGLLLLIQGLCVYFTQSRGPLLGLLAGAFFFALLGALVMGRRWGVALLGLGGIPGVLFFLALGAPHTPLTALRSVPYLGRFVGGFGDRTFQGRLEFWRGALEMIGADPRRFLIGYGPDTTFISFPPYFSAALVQLHPGERPDQVHNLILHLLATTGLLGLSAYLVFFSALVYVGLSRLGMLADRRQKMAWLGLWMGGGLVGAGLTRLVEGTWRLVGLGGPLGLLAGLALYLIARAFWVQETRSGAEPGKTPWLLIGLLAGLLAHFTETQFGITVAAIWTTFWLYAALVGRLGQGELAEVVPSEAPQRRPRRKRGRRRAKKRRRAPPPPGRGTSLVAGLIVGLVLVTTVYGFITRLFTFDGRGLAVLGLMAGLWLWGGGSWMVGRWLSSAFSWPLYALGSLGLTGAFFIPYRSIAFSLHVINVIVVYYMFLLLALGAMAWALVSEAPWPWRWWRGSRAVVYPVLGLACLALIALTSVRIGRADITFQIGRQFHEQRHYERAVEFYERALTLVPEEDHYHLYVGLASLAQMQLVATPEEQARWFGKGRLALERGRALNPLDPDYVVNLGQLYLAWGTLAANAAEQIPRLEQALRYYRQATQRSPYGHGPRIREYVWRAYALLGDAYRTLGQWDRAILAYEQAKAIKSDHFAIRRNLAIVYQRMGWIRDALAEAEAALPLAPEGEKEALQALIRELESALR